jgi:Flp pilus assembly protein TadB
MSNKKRLPAGGGNMGLAWFLTFIFIILKLVGVITWSWVWVLSPLWISFVIGAVALIVVMIFFSKEK